MSFGQYLVWRLIYALGVLVAISFLVFMIVQIPSGDAVDQIVANRSAMGDIVTPEEAEALRMQYGLDKPILIRYVDWMTGFFTGQLGRAISGVPVIDLIRERIGATVLLSAFSLVLTYAVAIPIGIYTATRQHTLADYFWTFVGFIGLATPNFLLALILLFVFHKAFGLSIGGLFSPGMAQAPWSLEKVIDLINHLWIPVIVIVTASTAATIRTMRATLLDELGKPYVVTARAKGVPARRLLFKYPVRLALNPIVASLAIILPTLISGETITSIVLNLPTMGPLLLNALMAEDVQLAASVLMFQSMLAVIGVFAADIALMLYDPRIRMERKRS